MTGELTSDQLSTGLAAYWTGNATGTLQNRLWQQAGLSPQGAANAEVIVDGLTGIATGRLAMGPGVPLTPSSTGAKANLSPTVASAEADGEAGTSVAITNNIATGRYVPNNLKEQLAMEQAVSNPAAGRRLPIPMTDPRWPAAEGWVKMSQNVRGVEIHYVMNVNTGAIADFKFK